MLPRILAILFPIFAIVAAGYFYGRRHRPEMAVANRLNMDVFVPALVFAAMAGKRFELADYGPLAVAGLLVNLLSLRLLMAGQKDSLNVRGAYLEALSDLIGSVGVIVGALVLMREKAAQPAASALTRFWVWLGDASYALYFVHPFVVVGVRKLWLAAGLAERLGLWPMVAAMIVASVTAALLVHEMIEKPITAALTRKRVAPA